ncbi:hypothetical protein Pan3_36 [Pseudanabaena phage Pan3]|nr:hypothetical protein Pan3_36 [Pseudanabaena phage Pan3]
MTNWKVGDTLVEIDRTARHPHIRKGTVTKIGRKWVTYRADGYWRDDRFDPATGLVVSNGYVTRHKVYRTMAAYEADLALEAKQRELAELFRRARPEDYTEAEIDALKAMLTREAEGD